jgi:hypothetical protein
VHGLAVGDVVRILKQGTQAGTEAVVTNPDLDGEKEITVLRISGPKTGRSAMYARDEVKRTGKTMLPEQIEEIRRGVLKADPNLQSDLVRDGWRTRVPSKSSKGSRKGSKGSKNSKSLQEDERKKVAGVFGSFLAPLLVS